MNWDASFDWKTNKMGGGVVVRDSEGKMIVVVCFKGDAVLSPLVVEIKVLWCTLKFCLEIGIHNIILDGDAKKVIDEVHSFEENLSVHGQLIEDVK